MCGIVGFVAGSVCCAKASGCGGAPPRIVRLGSLSCAVDPLSGWGQPVVSSSRAVAEIHLKANPVIVLRTTEENAGSCRLRRAFTRL